MKTLIVVILIMVSHVNAFAKKHYAIISGTISTTSTDDSVVISVNPYGNDFTEFLGQPTVYKAKIVNHHFNLKVVTGNIPLFAELHLGTSNKFRPLYGYLLEDNDRIIIKSDDKGFSFNGSGSEKFKLMYQMQTIRENDFAAGGGNNKKDFNLKIQNIDASATRQLHLLYNRREAISKNVFVLIKAQILGIINAGISTMYQYGYLGAPDTLREQALAAFKSYHRDLPQQLMATENFNQNELLKYSGYYATSIILKYRMDSCYAFNKPFVFENCYRFIVKTYFGSLRERILTNLFYHYRNSNEDMATLLSETLTSVKNIEFIRILKNLQNTHIKGATAFNFKLKDSLGIDHRLTDYKGKVILMDFWFTGCGACVKIAPYLERMHKEFADQPVIFISINVDKERSRWIKSSKEGKYNSDYSVNLFTDGKALSHPLCRFYGIDGCPTLILIDKNGKLMQNPAIPWSDNAHNLAKLIKEGIE